MFCPNCGKKIQAGSRFCPYCGADLANFKNNRPSPALKEHENHSIPMMNQPKRRGHHKKLWVIGAVVVIIILALLGFHHHQNGVSNQQSNGNGNNNQTSTTRYVDLKVKGFPNSTVYLNGKPKGTLDSQGKGTVKHVKSNGNRQLLSTKYKSFKSNPIKTILSDGQLYQFGLPNYIPKTVRSRDFKYAFVNCPQMDDSTTIDTFFGHMSFDIGMLSTRGEVPHQIPSKDKEFRKYFDLSQPSVRSAYHYMTNIMDKYHSKPEHSCEVVSGNSDNNDPKDLRIQYKNNRTYVSFENDTIISYEGKTKEQRLKTKWTFQLKRINGKAKIVSAHHGNTANVWESKQSDTWHGHNLFRHSDNSKMFDGLKNSDV